MNRIAMEFDYSPNIDVILVGGQYNKKLGGSIGPSAIEQIKCFKIDKAFIGAGGVNVEGNFASNFNYDESFVKREILKNSKSNYIVIDDDKFYKDGSYKFGKLEEVDYIITEKEPEESIKMALKEYEVKLIF